MENIDGELSGKYCSKLGTSVMVLKTTKDGNKTERRCLSSHLCHSDERKSCDVSQIQKEIKNNQNTL